MESSIMPKLSIILPVYNGEEYIGQTIGKLLKTTYSNIELVIVDDGSKDNSLQICQEYAASDSRVKVYHKENEGVAAARNYGISHAAGEYIGFCDQDDEVSDKMYEIMMARLISDKSQAVICGSYRKKANGEKIVFEHFEDDVFEKEQIIEKLLLPMVFNGFAEYGNENISIYMTIWKCIISKSLIDEKNLMFRKFVNYEDDLIMLIQLLLNSERISTVSDILYFWNTNLKSETYRCRKKYVENLELRQQKLIGYIKGQLENGKISDEIVNKYIYVAECRNALLLLDNLSTAGESLKSKLNKIMKSKSVRHIQNAESPVKARKGYIRNMVIIPLIRKRHILTAYSLNSLINVMRFQAEKYKITEKMERGLKRSGNEK
jgi:glycosyltransferase involved in cell wall biosynthesis